MVSLDVLDAVVIPISCPVSWDAMHGDCRTRFCDRCSQNVHDVSAMSRAEAVQLLTDSAGAPCLRIYRRQDGRVMTADCATRRERIWKWLDRRSSWAAALFALVFFVGCEKPTCLMGEPPYRPPVAQPESLHAVLGGPAAVTLADRHIDTAAP